MRVDSEKAEMSIDFTVAIRTYNGALRLPAVFDRLLAQEATEGIRWEVLVVDNNSQDETAAVVARYAQHWRSDSQLRYALEPRQGRSFARDRAMMEAASQDLVGFLDDDNLPSLNWIAAAYQFAQTHPQAGAYGGNIQAHLEQEPPSGFDQVQFLLALNTGGDRPFVYQGRGVPVNPGCVIRKAAWQTAVPQRRRLRGGIVTDRLCASVGEDVEVMHYIRSGGWELWHTPDIEVSHTLPPQRLERDYLLKYAQSTGLSMQAWRIARLKPWQRPWISLLVPFYTLLSLARLAGFYLKYQADVAHDLPKACTLQLLLGVPLSPFVTPAPIGYDDVPVP